jgi:tetratricopeptide (TPR) repeat protein
VKCRTLPPSPLPHEDAGFNLGGVSDVLAGLLSAALLTNSPQVLSNLAAEKTGASVPVINTNDPVENEYYNILLADDAAEKDILKWTDNAAAPDPAGGGEAKLTLNMRVRQRLGSVRQLYENFLQRNPKHVNARLAFGSFLNDTGDEDAAITQWDSARLLAPTNPAPWNNLANIYGHHGPIKKAFEYYDKAIELNPNESVYYHNLAVTVYLYRPDAREYYNLTEQQVFDKSLALYRQAIKLAPDDFILFSDYAESFYGTNPPRWKDGLEAWTHALKIAHDDVERQGVFVHLARINIKLGNFDAARERLNSVTNEMYASLKKTLTRRLNEALAEAATNAPASAAAPK